MRTSSGTPPQKGCVLTSSRPASKSKPSRRITCSHSARCASTANGPRARSRARAPAVATTRSIRPGSHWRTSPNTRSTVAQVMPGSKRSISASYRARPDCCRQQRGLLARDRQHRSSCTRKPCPVVGRALAAPGMLAARGGQLATLHQRPAARWRRASRAGSRAGWRAGAPTAAPARRAQCARTASGSVRSRCISAAISASAAARASLPLGGMLAAWSQPAIEARCWKWCSRWWWLARSS